MDLKHSELLAITVKKLTRPKSLVYITNSRLPTEKAHGYQICKMCEAFAQRGLRVLLLHPRRHQSDPELHGKNLFDYYGIPPVFEVRTLHNWDVVRLNLWLSDQALAPLFFFHSLLWGLYASRLAKREKAELYYTRTTGAAFWLLKLGLPTVFEAHVVHQSGQRWLLKQIARNQKLAMVPVLTPFIKKQFLTMGFPKEKLFVSPDAVDLTLFEDLPSKEECRRLLDLPLDHPIIGYIGRFQTMGKEKGIPELVEMMAHLSSVNGKRPLLLCVGGPTTAVPTYLRRAESMGIPKHTLKFLDRVPNSEVPRVIKACDVCTIPWPWTEFSAYYTSPLKLFEYMAAGVPVVASDLPSLKEILRHDKNAWLVPPGNPSALADGVKTLLLDRSRAKRLAVKARQDVKAYTWKDRAAQIIELIRQMKPERN